MKKLLTITKLNKFLRFTNIIVFIFLVTSLFSVTFAYWHGISPQTQNKKIEKGLNIGFWETMPYINFEENSGVIPRKTIVVKNNVYYVSLMDIPADDPYRDPETKPTSSSIPMRYCESTREYRWFHRYTKNDVVIFEGKIYRWKRTTYDHKPNTSSQKLPTSSYHWEELGVENTLSYSRYKIYPKYSFVCMYKGTLFDINNFYCAINEQTNVVNIDEKPDAVNSIFWKKIVCYEYNMIYPKGTIVYNRSGDLNTHGVFVAKQRVPAFKSLNNIIYWLKIGDFPSEFN